MSYRTPAEVAEDRDLTPRLSFYQRWHITIHFAVGYFLIGLPMQFALGDPSPWWVLGGLLLVGVGAWLERKYLAPARLRDAECIAWLQNLPRTPDGGALVDRDGWNKHFGADRRRGE